MTARLSAGLLAHLVARVLFHLNPRVFTHAQLDHLSDGGEPKHRRDEEEHPQATQRTPQEPTGDLEFAGRGAPSLAPQQAQGVRHDQKRRADVGGDGPPK